MTKFICLVTTIVFLASQSLTDDSLDSSRDHLKIESFADIVRVLQHYAEANGYGETFESLKQAFQYLKPNADGSLDDEVLSEMARTLKPEPDCFRNVTQLITSKGYGCEQHDIQTPDGFILSAQRMSSPTVPKNSSKVVILQHGLFDSAVTWIINFPHQSFGYILADAGFDVWLINSRGNKYSHSSVKYTPDQREFWAFSWDEMSLIDVPAVVDYVTNTTGVDKLHYIGHSEGTLTGFVAFSQKPETAAKIERFYAMAPITNMGNVTGLARLYSFFYQPLYTFLNTLGKEEVLPNSKVNEVLGRTVCTLSPIACELGTFFMCGEDFQGFNRSRTPMYMSHYPTGTSLRNMDHWGQMITTGKTQKYDFGKKGNMEHYGQETAPEYYMSNMTVPVSIFTGGHDPLADPKDVEIVKATFANVIDFQMHVPEYNHIDFNWGITAHADVYKVIVDQINNGVKGQQ